MRYDLIAVELEGWPMDGERLVLTHDLLTATRLRIGCHDAVSGVHIYELRYAPLRVLYVGPERGARARSRRAQQPGG